MANALILEITCMLKILVTGSNGQIGNELKVHSTHYESQFEFTFIDRSHLDLGDVKAIENYFNDNMFDVIINCAAYTAVDKAEAEPLMADKINHQAVKVIAQIAKNKKIKFIHISTDYIFNGLNHKPYTESDLTSPINMYGKTKCLGEEAIFSIAPSNTIIIRTSWVYSSFGNNFVKTMLRLGGERESLNVIFDQVGTPTYAADLAKMILKIIPKIENSSPVAYHYSSEGVASWYDFAKAIFEAKSVNCILRPITSSEYPTPAKRPHYSLLDKTHIKTDFNISIPYWKDSLLECLKLL